MGLARAIQTHNRVNDTMREEASFVGYGLGIFCNISEGNRCVVDVVATENVIHNAHNVSTNYFFLPVRFFFVWFCFALFPLPPQGIIYISKRISYYHSYSYLLLLSALLFS